MWDEKLAIRFQDVNITTYRPGHAADRRTCDNQASCGGMNMAGKVLTLLASCAALASCGAPGVRNCGKEASITDREIVNQVVSRIIMEGPRSSLTPRVQYATVEDFFRRNPSCCFITRPSPTPARTFQLPLQSEVEVTIRYRRLVSGERPYSLRHVTIGPCPRDHDDSELPITMEEYNRSQNWRWDWRVE
jgi:hypothetical protein